MIFYSQLRRYFFRWSEPSFVHPALARKYWKPWQFIPPIHVRQKQLKLLCFGHLEQRIQGWAASSSRMGIEYRYPLLDRRLIEFVLGLPAEQFRFGKNHSRWFFRLALQSV